MGNRRAKDIIRILKNNGFVQVSQRGSHKKFKKGLVTVIIPDHGGKDLGFGLIKAIEKQTGVKLI
ncbi:type II toxin-antitoxin system HicA family toxin [Halobacteriovorax sp. RZ-2]|uniref:type II toxin-antitoxin system HicA family toxin n=1 Tax=unclassified Halobacteriovorax TaxID=2639665 RepID=UPI00371E00DB